MNLLHYTHRGLALVMLALMALWGMLFYFTMLDEVMDETDDALESNRELLVQQALKHPALLRHNRCPLHAYTFRPLTPEEACRYEDCFYDTLRYFPGEDDWVPVRIMKSCVRMADGSFYELELHQSTMERDDMVEALLVYLGILFVLLWLCSVLGMHLVLKKVFRPLGRLLAWLDEVVPGRPAPPLENTTAIREFRRLNEAAVAMSLRSEKVYREQKQFIENAAHELQTPLALVRGRLELLADSEGLSEAQLQGIDESLHALNRAVQLNKSLLLLSRISNGQFPERSEVRIDKLLGEATEVLLDIYEAKHLRVEWTATAPCRFTMNEGLARVLLDNIVKNAVVHTPDEGLIRLSVTTHEVRVSNSGDTPLDADLIFRRFYHGGSGHAESTGLGLAIVRSIADLYGIRVTYRFDGGHVFVLTF